jgi:hypothetical protein
MKPSYRGGLGHAGVVGRQTRDPEPHTHYQLR